MRGLSSADTTTGAFLASINEGMTQMQWAIGLDLLASALSVGIALFLFTFINDYNERLAHAYLGIALVTFVIVAISNVFHVALFSVSEDFVSGVTGGQPLIGLGNMLYHGYYWLHFLILMLYGIGGCLLFFYLLKTALVPAWLAVWGLLANSIVFTGGALQLFEIPVSFYLFVQNGVFLLSFVIWLLIRGFKVQSLQLDI